MNSRIYYGEYSLRHWLRLIKSGNIVLPDYQRSFVWRESDMRRLIKSLVERQFVQPITLALFDAKNGEAPKNLIIDGQQRLTTILLTALGYVPYLDKFEADDSVATGDDSSEDDAGSTSGKIPVKWTFQHLLYRDVKENTDEAIVERMVKDGRYYVFKYPNLPNDFLDKTFLGFSYIIPESDDETEIQNSYTQLFRNINYFGARLSVMESRRSLYYMKSQYRRYFEGLLEDDSDVLCGIRLFEKLTLTKIDFVRYLSTLSQYKILGDSSKVLRWYSAYSTRESFYGDYVSSIVGVEQEGNDKKFDGFDFTTIFPNDCWKKRFVVLRDAINSLKLNFALNKDYAFTSWIDADYWLFGLIYYLVFEGKTLKADTIGLVAEITKRIKTKRVNDYYAKTPNRLGNLRERMGESIMIYKKYVQ